MARLSLIFPSRDERFLIPSIRDAFRSARGEFEVVAVIDSNLWPEGWKEVCDQYPNLHTIHHGTSKGMRAAINSGVGSAISRGAKYIAKFDAHCSFSEGFDEILKSECEPNWIVVPRRKRLNPEIWQLTDTNKPDVDYHYLSFPDDPKDFGGPGLNGKIWTQRAVERKDILLDDEMSSQGSGWFMHASYFTELELMDEANYGKFWNEFQELGLKCWLSGGQVKVNKKCWYSHWHKGKAGRGYRLEESALQQGASFTKNWIWNEAWPKQTLPFKWLIEKFWPVPSWPDNWEEVLYAERKPEAITGFDTEAVVPAGAVDTVGDVRNLSTGLVIHAAQYGISPTEWIDVAEQLRSLVKDGSLDVVVTNSALGVGNPFRGKRKSLTVTYSIDGGEKVFIEREEKDWLIIGNAHQSAKFDALMNVLASEETAEIVSKRDGREDSVRPRAGSVKNLGPHAIPGLSEKNNSAVLTHLTSYSGNRIVDAVVQADLPRTAAALNDYLIRRFSISPQRLRGPMPIELRDFHRNDLAQLFAEVGFKRGCEVGVAEGHFSEILLKANPECELFLVDPWHAYSENPQNKSPEKNEYAYREAVRKVGDYPNVKFWKMLSMDAVRDVEDDSLDFVYIDGHHSYPYVMCDIIEWTKKVRSGGIVALDDIYKLDEARWGAGPMEAIYDYTRAMRINPWWLIAAHKSVDAFFVKP